jgi:hypothetical protein
MADDIFPELTTPIPLTQAARHYTGYLVYLSLSPRIDGGTLDMTANAKLLPFRKLADGTIDPAPDHLAKTFSFGSLVDERGMNGGNGTAFSRFIDKLVVTIRDTLKSV